MTIDHKDGCRMTTVELQFIKEYMTMNYLGNDELKPDNMTKREWEDFKKKIGVQ